MRVQDIMNTDVKVISASAAVSDARATMRANRIRHLIVQDGSNIVGVVSDRDFGIRSGDGERRRIEDVMTTGVVTAAPDMTIRRAANLFRGRSIGCLPVVGDRGRPVGIITTTDLLDLIGRGSERPSARSERRILSGRGHRQTGPSSRRERRT